MWMFWNFLIDLCRKFSILVIAKFKYFYVISYLDLMCSEGSVISLDPRDIGAAVFYGLAVMNTMDDP